MYCTEKATGTGPDVRSLAPGHNSETKPGLSATSWLPISSIGNSTSGIHIKRSLVSVGHFCLNQLHVHQSTYNLGSSVSHLTTPLQAPLPGPLLFQKIHLEGLADTPFTFCGCGIPAGELETLC